MTTYQINDVDGDATHPVAFGTEAEIRETIPEGHPIWQLIAQAERDGQATGSYQIDGETYTTTVSAKDRAQYRVHYRNWDGATIQAHNDAAAVGWMIDQLVADGIDRDAIVVSDWQTDGQDDDSNDIDSVLFWRCEADAANDDGSKAVARLRTVRS